MPSGSFDSSPFDFSGPQAGPRLVLQSTTTVELLDRLLAPADEPAWNELDQRYRPVLLGFAKRLGVSDEDAEDVAQETLLRVVRSYAQSFDRERGRLRSWMIGIARRVVHDLVTGQARRREIRGESAIVDLPDEDRCEEWIEEECRRTVRVRALGELAVTTRFDARTIRAFERVVLGGESPADVAAALEMSVDSVYTGKHRCLRELRKIVARLEPLYELGV